MIRHGGQPVCELLQFTTVPGSKSGLGPSWGPGPKCGKRPTVFKRRGSLGSQTASLSSPAKSKNPFLFIHPFMVTV